MSPNLLLIHFIVVLLCFSALLLACSFVPPVVAPMSSHGFSGPLVSDAYPCLVMSTDLVLPHLCSFSLSFPCFLNPSCVAWQPSKAGATKRGPEVWQCTTRESLCNMSDPCTCALPCKTCKLLISTCQGDLVRCTAGFLIVLQHGLDTKEEASVNLFRFGFVRIGR